MTVAHDEIATTKARNFGAPPCFHPWISKFVRDRKADRARFAAGFRSGGLLRCGRCRGLRGWRGRSGRFRLHLGEILRIVVLGFDLLLSRLDHRGRGEKSAVDKLGHVAFMHEPHDVAMQTGDLFALFGRELVGRGGWGGWGGGGWEPPGLQVVRARRRVTAFRWRRQRWAAGWCLWGRPSKACRFPGQGPRPGSPPGRGDTSPNEIQKSQ